MRTSLPPWFHTRRTGCESPPLWRPSSTMAKRSHVAPAMDALHQCAAYVSTKADVKTLMAAQNYVRNQWPPLRIRTFHSVVRFFSGVRLLVESERLGCDINAGKCVAFLLSQRGLQQIPMKHFRSKRRFNCWILTWRQPRRTTQTKRTCLQNRQTTHDGHRGSKSRWPERNWALKIRASPVRGRWPQLHDRGVGLVQGQLGVPVQERDDDSRGPSQPGGAGDVHPMTSPKQPV